METPPPFCASVSSSVKGDGRRRGCLRGPSTPPHIHHSLAPQPPAPEYVAVLVGLLLRKRWKVGPGVSSTPGTSLASTQQGILQTLAALREGRRKRGCLALCCPSQPCALSRRRHPPHHVNQAELRNQVLGGGSGLGSQHRSQSSSTRQASHPWLKARSPALPGENLTLGKVHLGLSPQNHFQD